MDLKDLLPAHSVGRQDRHSPVKPAGPQQRRVEDLRPVGRAEDHDRLGRFESVHLGQDLIQSLLALVVGTRDARRALPRAADRVKLVDEDDCRRCRLGLAEKVAHAGGADADDRLDEFRGGDREEGRVGLARHGPGEQRLPRPWSAEQQNAVGHPSAELLVALGAA